MPINMEAGWDPEHSWTFWRRERSFACDEIGTPYFRLGPRLAIQLY